MKTRGKTTLSSVYLTASILLALAGIYFFGEETVKPYRKPYYFAPPESIQNFAFGYNDVYADLLWIRYIQNADYCNYEQGLPKYDGKTRYKCHKGWAYYMAHAITELAPRFKKPYLLSGTMLSVIVGDKEGARLISEKAVKQFPNDWDVYFHAGYHYLIELDQPEQAARSLLKAAQLGGPIWLYSLSAKLYTKAGRLNVAEKLLKKVIEEDPESQYIKTLKERLEEVQQKKQKAESAPEFL